MASLSSQRWSLNYTLRDDDGLVLRACIRSVIFEKFFSKFLIARLNSILQLGKLVIDLDCVLFNHPLFVERLYLLLFEAIVVFFVYS